jgi:hypothetical protein
MNLLAESEPASSFTPPEAETRREGLFDAAFSEEHSP